MHSKDLTTISPVSITWTSVSICLDVANIQLELCKLLIKQTTDICSKHNCRSVSAKFNNHYKTQRSI